MKTEPFLTRPPAHFTSEFSLPAGTEDITYGFWLHLSQTWCCSSTGKGFRAQQQQFKYLFCAFLCCVQT